AADPDELLEVPGDELRAVVGDDPRRNPGEPLPRSLHDLLHVGLGHRLAQFPMDDEAATAVEQAAQVVERAGDVDVRDINVPMLWGRRGWTKPLPLEEALGVWRSSRPAALRTR